jgi:1-deoxy-D-xylulose-5-phosphate reductoisomerase
VIRRSVALLGSTGSIGTQTLAVIEALNQRGHNFSVVALAAGKNIELLAAQALRFRPALIAIERAKDIRYLKDLVKTEWSGEIVVGEEGLLAVATHPQAELVVNALVGITGLIPTLEALKAHKIVALANKESLVVGGHLVNQTSSGLFAFASQRLAKMYVERSSRSLVPHRQRAQRDLTDH